MYLSRTASKARLREAQNARNNRAEIVKALSQGQVTRRELIKWGLFTASGLLVAKNGLSPFARSAYAGGSDIPTGTPPSPLFGALPFTQPMPRLNLQEPVPLTDVGNPERDYSWGFPFDGEDPCKRLSYHTDFSDSGGTGFLNPITGIGPMEGRAPGEFYAHQRWDEYSPQKGRVISIGQCKQTGSGTRFHSPESGPETMPAQNPNSVWTFGTETETHIMRERHTMGQRHTKTLRETHTQTYTY